MKIIKNILVLCALLISLPALSWEKLENGISLDKSVHEFGDVQLGSGPLSCRFTFRNDSGKSLLIERVTSSCGCTDVKWTNTVIKSGETGEVSVVYKNDEGPWPFEKSLTVYLSSQSRPLYLKIRGVCHSKPVQLKEVYTESLGASLAVKSLEIKGGNLEQGGQRCDCFLVANLSDKAIKLSFTDLPKQIQIMGLPLTIPAKKTARVDFCVKADSQLWGKNWYSITPVINGAKGKKALKIWKRHNPKKGTKFYLFCGFKLTEKSHDKFYKDIWELFQRIRVLMSYGCVGYVMRHEDYHKYEISNLYIQIARWCNQQQFYKKMSFWEFAYRNQSYWEENTLKIKDRPALKSFQEFEEDLNNGYYGNGDGQVKMCLPLQTVMKTLERFPQHREELLDMFNYKMVNLINPKLWE